MISCILESMSYLKIAADYEQIDPIPSLGFCRVGHGSIDGVERSMTLRCTTVWLAFSSHVPGQIGDVWRLYSHNLRQRLGRLHSQKCRSPWHQMVSAIKDFCCVLGVYL